MKKIIMSVIALAVISMTIGFVACKKEKETINENQNQNENVERKPIAVVDLTTGHTKCMIDTDKIQSKINEQFAEKGQNDRYIIESVEFEQNAFEFKDSTCSALKIILIDTKKEISITQWLYGGFLETAKSPKEIMYYFNDSVLSGNYEFYTNQGGKTIRNVMKNNILVSSEKDENNKDGLETAPHFPWSLSCTTGPKCQSCSKYIVNFRWYCRCDQGHDQENGKYCSATTDSGNTISILALIVAAVGLLLL